MRLSRHLLRAIQMYQFFSDEILGLPAETANLLATAIVALFILFILYMLYRMITRPRLASGRRSKHARLAITDAASVDERRKLVLIRRDDVEHLVMIGGNDDIVIESNIRRTEPARPMSPQPTPVQTTTAPAISTSAAAPAPTAVAPVATVATAPAAPQVATASSVKTVPATQPTPSVTAPVSQPAIDQPASTVSSVSAPVSAALAGAAATTVTKAADVAPPSSVKQQDAVVQPASKTSIGDDMDALLDEMTIKK